MAITELCVLLSIRVYSIKKDDVQKTTFSGDSHSGEVLFCLKTSQTALSAHGSAVINLTLNLILQSHLSSCKCTVRLLLNHPIPCDLTA